MDQKQQRIIEAWKRQAENSKNDPYFKFMALWIAFNAACYALYHSLANQPQVRIRKLHTPNVGNFSLSTEIKVDKNDTSLKAASLSDNVSINLKISEKYVEQHIFDQFATEFKTRYKSEMDTSTELCEAISEFRDAICKVNGHYVLNLSKGGTSDVENWSLEQIERGGQNAVASFHDEKDLRQAKNAIYQVRCNIFHGEKIPGDLNDSKITRAALPVLEYFLKMVLS